MTAIKYAIAVTKLFALAALTVAVLHTARRFSRSARAVLAEMQAEGSLGDLVETQCEVASRLHVKLFGNDE